MKEKISFLLAAGLLPLTAAAGQNNISDKLYVTGDIGAAFEQGTRIRGTSDLIDFHNGVRGDLALGYQMNSWFAAELATGAIWTSADKIGGVPISSFGGGLDLYQIPVMGNAIFSAPVWHGFKPYVGGGLGGVFGMIDFQRPLGSIRDTDFTFSYQAVAGLNYELSQNVELGVGYKFLHTSSHDWSENNVTLQTEGTGTHSVTASLTWHF
jgi:opacity protein-like surface antigen